MTLMSLTAFAATHGTSRQAASKWKAKGFLKLRGDQVDVEASDQRLRDAGLGRFKAEAAGAQPPPATAPRNRRAVAGATGRAVAAVVDEVVADLRDAAEEGEIDEGIAGDFIQQLLAGQFQSKANAGTIKENALALKHWLGAQREAEQLVEVEVAVAVIFDDRRAARDAWMAFPARFAPLLAADLDIDGATLAEALKPYVHQQLDELGEPDLDFSGVDEG
ncbi:hypothetical protein [Sphingomonas sp. S-NIH.Pt15_0812]|uniref:hypothetical protein n=1 Tax=Sphingomonas sp. S-NIH.Pt15_0812 TaxID=1920129 RepID=UPI000F7EB3A6|nr:hypothetical protein [Sphingomonas sp. S-NIH.Pt15_0812]RSU46333.1 hypothetical protein BRX43_15840 [Sphingomonas sp. S-NIH.Pt15_0812]